MRNSFFASIILPTRNRPAYLKECLRTLVVQDYPYFEIIVVDSSNNQKTKEVVKEYPQVRYLRFYNGKNMAVSRNIGIDNAYGEIVVFIDDDCYVQKDWLKELLSCFYSEEIGGVGGRVITQDGLLYTADISQVGRLYPNGIFSGFLDCKIDKPFSVDYLPGCNSAFRKEILLKIGGFDHLLCELDDLEISTRLKELGYQLIFNPKAVVFHVLAKREFYKRDRSDIRSQYIYNRNHAYILFKNKKFKYVYFKTLFFWKSIFTLKEKKINYNKRIIFICVQLFASLVGLLLGIKAKIKRKEDFIKKSRLIQRDARINVVHLCHCSSLYGGGANTMINICRFMNKDLINNLCLFINEGPLVEKIKNLGVECKIIKSGTINRFNIFPFLITLLKGILFFVENKTHILNLHTLRWRDPLLLAAKILRIKTIVRFASPEDISGWIKDVDLFIFNSQYTQNETLKNKSIEYWQRSKVVYNGICPEDFLIQSNNSFRNELGLDSGKIIVGFVGKVRPVKGVKYFIEAAEEILKIREVIFVIVGGEDDTDPKGEYLNKMKELVINKGIADKIIFTGWRRDVSNIMNSLDILVLPSLEEPLGNVLLEAGLCEKPVVASQIGGILEIVENGETGFLVPPADLYKLTKAILELIDNPDLRKKMGQKAKEKIMKKFNIKNLIDQMESIYIDLVNS